MLAATETFSQWLDQAQLSAQEQNLGQELDEREKSDEQPVAHDGLLATRSTQPPFQPPARAPRALRRATRRVRTTSLDYRGPPPQGARITIGQVKSPLER